jgi:hypothetical protein
MSKPKRKPIPQEPPPGSLDPVLDELERDGALDELAAWHTPGAMDMLGHILDAIVTGRMAPMPNTSSRRQ